MTMHRQKKTLDSRRKSTIGANPLDQLETVPGKKNKRARFKDDSAQTEIKNVLLKRSRPKQGVLSRWFKSVLGQFI